MSIVLDGQLTNPFGEPLKNYMIRFTSLRPDLNVPFNQTGVLVTDELGLYHSVVLEGAYLIETSSKEQREWHKQGEVLITEETESPISISSLVQKYEYLQPEPR